MLSIPLYSPHEVALRVAAAAQKKRLAANYSQATLAERSGVSLGAIKLFERTGKISLESLLKIAVILDALEEFLALFPEKAMTNYTSIEEALKHTPRKRGRK